MSSQLRLWKCRQLLPRQTAAKPPNFTNNLRPPGRRRFQHDVGYDSPISNQIRLSYSTYWKRDCSVRCSRQLSNSLTPKQLDFSSAKISQQSFLLQELEFRRFFLILSYIGGIKLEDAMSEDDAIDIVRNHKKLSMVEFESSMWLQFGQNYVPKSFRVKYLDWDCGKSHHYHCYVRPDGSYFFKGPYLNTTRTHLQRALRDENVLTVKFAEEGIKSINLGITSSGRIAAYSRIVEKGIMVGDLWRYRFFVFKDGGKEERKKGKKETTVSWGLKCYFVRMESNASWLDKPAYIFPEKKVNDVRCLFMHIHMVSSMAKYISRLSLILSQTIKLQVDLTKVKIETIEDIPCRDENGIVVRDKNGEPLIHTDGTGYISEDLAAVCPKEFQDAKYMKDEHLQGIIGQVELAQAISTEATGIEARIKEPPLLMQCRLFHNGSAIKGTFLVNKKLPFSTIQVRPSMVKVETDPRLPKAESFNSLEVVSVSHKPRKASLSKNLIALLSIGDVPEKFFLGLQKKAMEDAHGAYTKVRPALRALLNSGERDDYRTAAKMIVSGIPLDEPCLQCHLASVANEMTNGLGGGKLPLDESFYLMGTADPTGVLESNQVCVILEHGQVCGKVLVYRNPGLHFGDIHVLNAVYVEAMEDVVGNSKYGIFFSTKGQRSTATEIANGDFDGDMYWVCINDELLKCYKPSAPWNRIYSTPSGSSKKPDEISPAELDHELFQLLLDLRNQSSIVGIAADSWLAHIDEFMVLGACNKKDQIREKILMLVDIYYDAIDAVKSGKKVEVPYNLRADKFPHHMEKGKAYEYHSSSVIGQIYDEALKFEAKLPIEIKKLHCFDVPVPDACLKTWKERYDAYRKEMAEALNCGDSSKDSANDLIKKYKELLYEAPEFEESCRDVNDIYNDALALYHVTYDHVMMTRGTAKKCCFAWRIAGSALCKLYQMHQNERPIVILPSVLRQLLQDTRTT